MNECKSLAPGTIPGDIVFVVQEKEHALFKRKGPDLFLEKSISLTVGRCRLTPGRPRLTPG